MTQAYTSVFGSETIPPTDNSFQSYTLTADTTFFWPEQASSSWLLADTLDIAMGAAYAITMPAANVASPGRSVIFNNISAFTLTLKDQSGVSLGTVDAGVAKCLYLTDNTTAD